MNPCLAFIPCDDLHTCVNDLTIGTISNLSTSVNVQLINMTTGRVNQFTVTSTSGGIVKIPLASTILIANSTYSVQVINGNVVAPVTIGILTGNELRFRVKLIHGVNVENKTLTA